MSEILEFPDFTTETTTINTQSTETTTTNEKPPPTPPNTTKNNNKLPRQPKQPKPPKESVYKYVPQPKREKPKEQKQQQPNAHTTKRKPLDLNSLSINEKCEMEEKSAKGKRNISGPPAAPTEVLPHLFLGSAVNAADSVLVSTLGLGCVLNVAEELIEMVNHDGVESIRMVVHDFMPEGMDQYSIFEEAFTLIDRAKESSRPILVHCMRGRSRSATIVIAYLMSRQKWTLKEAHSHVKKLRPYIGPHRRLKKQLMLYERHLYGTISVVGEGWVL